MHRPALLPASWCSGALDLGLAVYKVESWALELTPVSKGRGVCSTWGSCSLELTPVFKGAGMCARRLLQLCLAESGFATQITTSWEAKVSFSSNVTVIPAAPPKEEALEEGVTYKKPLRVSPSIHYTVTSLQRTRAQYCSAWHWKQYTVIQTWILDEDITGDDAHGRQMTHHVDGVWNSVNSHAEERERGGWRRGQARERTGITGECGGNAVRGDQEERVNEP
ncbi:uncharacterized protein LOC115280214 [Suricata suricatta]|uniref:uncharacterized protein LOC115280214 n=1 Tax=Suricata suricatta TaxID=37032 RepID=UPI0011558076|nr:uncharacterized protein LOC115280214 [Suricata suricatta]